MSWLDTFFFGSTTVAAATSNATVSALALRDSTGSSQFVGITLTTGALTLGTANTSTTGLVRAQNAKTVLAALNAAGTGDISVIGTSASDAVSVGDTTNAASVALATKSSGYVALNIGSTTIAAAGTVRLPKVQTIAARNNGNTADITVAATDASDNVNIGDGTNTASVQVNAKTGGYQSFTIGGIEAARFSGSTLVFNNSANPAASGKLRFANASLLIGIRNAANTGDITGMQVDGSDNLILGDGTNTANVNIFAKSSGVFKFTCGSNALGSMSSASTAWSFVADTTGAPGGFVYQANGVAQSIIFQAIGGGNIYFDSAALHFRDTALGASINITPSSVGTSTITSPATGTGLAFVYNATTRLSYNATGLGLYATAPVAQQTRAGQITDNTGGAATTTFAAITAGASYAQADMVAVKNALASIAAQYNKIDTIIHNIGMST